MSHFQQKDDCGRVITQVQSVGGKVSVLINDRWNHKAGVAARVADPAAMRAFGEAILLACDEAEENR